MALALCGRQSLSPHRELLTLDGLRGTNRESTFSLLLLGTCCWGLVPNKGKTSQTSVSLWTKPCWALSCSWDCSVLETQMVFATY